MASSLMSSLRLRPVCSAQNLPRRSFASSARAISVQDSLYAQAHTTPDVINFGLGQPSKSLLPLDLFREASVHRFQPSQDPALLQYGAGKGYMGFRSALARFLTDAYDRETSAEALMVTTGNSQAISHVATVLSKDPRRMAFVEQPTYFLAFDIFRELGLDLQSVPVDHHGLDVDALENKLRSGDVPSFVYTIPFYHNPTGAVLPSDRCKRLVQLAEEFDFSIISDEPYNLIGFGGWKHRSLASYDSSGRVISLGSFSKILAPGLRLGWAESSPETIDRLASLGTIRSGGGQNPVTASLVHSILDAGHLTPHISTLTRTFARRKQAMCNALLKAVPDCSFSEPDGGYFVWVKLPTRVSADDLYNEAVAKHGVAFTPGSRCALAPAAMQSRASPSQHIRLSFAFYDEDEIQEGIHRLAAAISALKS